MTHELLRKKEDIIHWLNSYHVRHYYLVEDENYGYMVNAKEEVDISAKNIDSIQVKFNEVKGNFFCNHNRLSSLKGSPVQVHGFFCNYNQLTSLKFSPLKIEGTFYCDHNRLTSLLGAPTEIWEDFSCSNNVITSLKGAPKIIGKNFYCEFNNIRQVSLAHLPECVGRDMCMLHNPLSEELCHITRLQDMRALLEREALQTEIVKPLYRENISKNKI